MLWKQNDFDFGGRPGTLASMLRAAFPSPGLAVAEGLPPLRLEWSGYRVNRRHLQSFLKLTGLRREGLGGFLYPHVFGFPLQLAILTHPRFPVPLWGSLQTRNRLLQHRKPDWNAEWHLAARIADHRIMEKGLEVDLYTSIRTGRIITWESLNTYYFRGRHGTPEGEFAVPPAPEIENGILAQWSMPAGTGWRFAGLTGDYNPIHLSRRMARRLGFERALHHTQQVLGQCFSHLPPMDCEPGLAMDTWLKGPVYAGSDVVLRGFAGAGTAAFSVGMTDEPRPGIIASLRPSGEENPFGPVC